MCKQGYCVYYDVGFALFSEGLSEGLYDEYLESIDETIYEYIKNIDSDINDLKPKGIFNE